MLLWLYLTSEFDGYGYQSEEIKIDWEDEENNYQNLTLPLKWR
jgi:hypothetical protein